MRKSIGIFAASALALAIAACGSDESATSEPDNGEAVTETADEGESEEQGQEAADGDDLQTDELVIGTTAPLSGPAAWIGETIVPAMDFAVEDINEAGGIVIGDTRYLLRHEPYDDEFNADNATSNVRRMIDQGVNFINTYSTNATAAVQPITEEAGVLTFNGAAGLAAVNPDAPLTFRVASASGTLAPLTYEAILLEYPDLERVGIINVNDETGQASTEAAAAAAEGQGLTVAAAEFYEPGTADYYPTLQRIINESPDVIDLSSTVEHGQIVLQARELGYEGLFIGPLANFGADIDIAGEDAMEGYFGFMAMDRDSEYNTDAQNDLWDRYAEAFPDRVPLTFLFEFYDAVTGLAQAIETAQSTDGAVVAEAWADLRWEGLAGEDLYFTGEETFGIQRELSYIPQYGVVTEGQVDETPRVRYEAP